MPDVPGIPTEAPAAPSDEGGVLLARAVREQPKGERFEPPIADLVNRQRIPLTLDPLAIDDEGAQRALVKARVGAVANLYLGMDQVKDNLKNLVASLAVRTAPAQLIGILLQPDGTGAGPVQVQFDPASLGNSAPKISVQSDESGAFQLPLPSGLLLPEASVLKLVIHGATSNVIVEVASDDIAANGLVGSLMLPSFVTPLPTSIVAALQNIAGSTPAPTTNGHNGHHHTELPVVKIGDDDQCLLQYAVNTSVDRFPFGIFYRLVEPRASVVSAVRSYRRPNGLVYLPEYVGNALIREIAPDAARGRDLPPVSPLALPAAPPAVPGEGNVTYVDRLPVEQPISVDGFRDQMAGLKPDGTFTADETRPMAGTLGLGYVLHMAQEWTLKGLGLGNLVYSLPLAPGEQQQVAIFERHETARVIESEQFDQFETQRQVATADTSTHATFNSAFNEAIHGSSSFQSESSSSGWGASIILVSGGGGSSSSSGSSQSSLVGQRNIAQNAAQTTHSAAENQAAARRSASRTGMRIATSSEAQNLTTKTITNHNKTRALTMQYWEVQRLYDVSTNINGLTLTVLVPMQVVRFMPPNQNATLDDPSDVSTRTKVLSRYRSIIKHGDVLTQALPRRYQHGLTMLLQFAADPTAEVDAFGGTAQDVIQFQLTGRFLACEDVSISVVTNRGTRIGPVELSNTAPMIPPDTFTTREELEAWLVGQRQYGSATFQGAIALPPSMNRSNVIGFEITRRFRSVSYTLVNPEVAELSVLQSLFPGDTSWVEQAIESMLGQAVARRQTITITPAQLEAKLGGPNVFGFGAAINEYDQNGNLLPSGQEQYANQSLNGVELPADPYPVPARQLSPVLRYNEILEIEKMAAHVVRRTMHYSRAVWASLSPDERAVMLEAYTIGVPPDGIEDSTQMVPLLNCVENKVLGFFGNSMILPFIIPQSLASRGVNGERMDPAKITESLLAFHQATFVPPKSTIALPTRGVLGEAVLGHCPSAEKVDITRFWNWQDSPTESAPAISPIELPTTAASVAGGLTAPNSLTNLPALVNNVLSAPTPDTSLLAALSKDAASMKDFDSGLTGMDQLAKVIGGDQTNANLARAEALKTTKDLSAQAMATAGNIAGGMFAGNPNAGSSAAAAVNGTQQPAPVPNQQQQQGQGGGKTGAPGPQPSGQSGQPGSSGQSSPSPSPNPSPSPGGSSTPAPTPAPGPPPIAPSAHENGDGS